MEEWGVHAASGKAYRGREPADAIDYRVPVFKGGNKWFTTFGDVKRAWGGATYERDGDDNLVWSGLNGHTPQWWQERFHLEADLPRRVDRPDAHGVAFQFDGDGRLSIPPASGEKMLKLPSQGQIDRLSGLVHNSKLDSKTGLSLDQVSGDSPRPMRASDKWLNPNSKSVPTEFMDSLPMYREVTNGDITDGDLFLQWAELKNQRYNGVDIESRIGLPKSMWQMAPEEPQQSTSLRGGNVPAPAPQPQPPSTPQPQQPYPTSKSASNYPTTQPQPQPQPTPSLRGGNSTTPYHLNRPTNSRSHSLAMYDARSSQIMSGLRLLPVTEGPDDMADDNETKSSAPPSRRPFGSIVRLFER